LLSKRGQGHLEDRELLQLNRLKVHAEAMFNALSFPRASRKRKTVTAALNRNLEANSRRKMATAELIRKHRPVTAPSVQAKASLLISGVFLTAR